MKNDFETHIDKLESGSVKWNEMKKANPAVGKGIVPLSVAEMECKTAPEKMWIRDRNKCSPYRSAE